LGLLLTLALPALAVMRLGFTDVTATVALAVTPYLTLAWVCFAERRSLATIGLTRTTWKLAPLGIAGALLNLAITASVTAISSRVGIAETQSDLMGRLLQGPGLLLVFLTTNGALLTEICFRAYATDFDSPSDETYRLIRAQLELAETPIGGNDLLVAAQAITFDYTLVTDDESEFVRIAGLRIEDWLRR
jgi:hypothetical protein